MSYLYFLVEKNFESRYNEPPRKPEETQRSPAEAEVKSTNRNVRSLRIVEPREVMDIRQAAEFLGVSTDSLYRYAAESIVPAFRLGNRWKFQRSRLLRWMEEQSGMVIGAQKKPVARAE